SFEFFAAFQRSLRKSQRRGQSPTRVDRSKHRIEAGGLGTSSRPAREVGPVTARRATVQTHAARERQNRAGPRGGARQPWATRKPEEARRRQDRKNNKGSAEESPARRHSMAFHGWPCAIIWQSG